MIIQHNTSASVTNLNLKISGRNQEKISEKLSSG